MLYHSFPQARKENLMEARLCRQLPTGPQEWMGQLTPNIMEQQMNEQLPMTPERMRTYRELQTEAQRYQNLAVTRFSIAQQALENMQRRTGNPNQAPYRYQRTVSILNRPRKIGRTGVEIRSNSSSR